MARSEAFQRPCKYQRESSPVDAICDGDADAFFKLSQNERDPRRICGVPPMYLALRLLGSCKGESLGYTQCPADANGGSLVSIVGVLLYEA